MDTWQRNANRRRKKTSDNALNVTKKDILPKTKGMQSIKKQRFKRNQMTKITRKSRVLVMILSMHGTRDLPCKFLE